MNVESIREYCMSLPGVTEDFPFDISALAFRIQGKIFAMIDLDQPKWFVLKCQPELAQQLREEHSEIAPAWHMNKRHWNQIDIYGHLSDNLMQALIRHSYAQVVKKLPLTVRQQHPEITAVTM